MRLMEMDMDEERWRSRPNTKEETLTWNTKEETTTRNNKEETMTLTTKEETMAKVEKLRMEVMRRTRSSFTACRAGEGRS